MRVREIVLGVFLVKLAIFGALYGKFGERIMIWGDSDLYIGLADNLRAGNGFATTRTDGALAVNTDRLPIFPALVALSKSWGGNLFLLGVLQAFVGALLARSAYVLPRRVLEKRWATFLALAVAFEPITLALGVFVLPDIYFALALLLHIESLLTYRDAPTTKKAVLVGLSYALALYLKPIMLYAGIISLVYMMWSRRSLKHVCVVLGITVILIAPWAWRTYEVSGKLGITTNDTLNFCGWGLTGVLSSEFHLDSSNWAESWARPEYQEGRAHCVTPRSSITYFATEYPVAYAKTIGLSTLAFFTNEGYGTLLQRSSMIKTHHNYLTPAVFTMGEWKSRVAMAWSELSPLSRVAVVFGKAFWVAVAVLALRGAWISRKLGPRTRTMTMLHVCIIIYFVGVITLSTAYGVSARLRVPVITPLFILALLAIPNARRKDLLV